jgi:hypothetical protein
MSDVSAKEIKIPFALNVFLTLIIPSLQPAFRNRNDTDVLGSIIVGKH